MLATCLTVTTSAKLLTDATMTGYIAAASLETARPVDVYLTSDADNTGTIVIGPSNVSTSVGADMIGLVELKAGQYTVLRRVKAQELYFLASAESKLSVGVVDGGY